MAAADTWMPLYIGDYLRDTGHLTTGEHGAYLLLLMQGWVRGGSLPNDDERLRILARASVKEWARSKKTIREFFYVADDGSLRQRRMDLELVKAANITNQRSVAGKASAEQRARQRESNGRSTDDEHPNQRNSIPSPSPSPVAAKEQQQRGRASANGTGPPKWDDAAIVPEPSDHRPTVNGWYLDYTFDAALEAANIDPARTAVTWKPVIGWLKANIEPEVIVAAIRRCAERDGYEPPSTLAYFDKPVRQGRVH